MKKDEKTKSFEDHLWDAACKLWGHISASEYRKVFLGLIFLRNASLAFEQRREELLTKGWGLEDDRDCYTMENVVFMPQEARWQTIAAAAHTPRIGEVIDRAMKAIEKENPKLEGVLPCDYAREELDKRALGDVVDTFTNMDVQAARQDQDLLGRTYEYCLERFAEREGKKGGEFYTPASIVRTIVEVLNPVGKCRIYDPCCGSGGMFVQSARFIAAHTSTPNDFIIFGQESNADTRKIAKMNLAIWRVEANLGAAAADTFRNDLHKNLRADYILANPPFNYHPWGQEELTGDPRWHYGLPPANNANFAWMQHMIYHLSPRGKIGLVLANGALSTQAGGEDQIRRSIIEDDLIEGIIALPTQLFYSVTIPVTLWFITKGKRQAGKTLFVDARKMGRMKDRKHREFTDDDITRLASTMRAFQEGTLKEERGFCAVATTQEIAAQEYILTPGRYVGIDEADEEDESFDEQMESLTLELADMFTRSGKLEEEIRIKLAEVGWEI